MNTLIKFDVGQVVSVNGNAVDGNGQPHPTIGVKSFLDGSTLVIPMLPAAFEQSTPALDYYVLYLRVGRHQARLVKFWGNDEEFVRKGFFGLNAGEVFIQSATGLGYLKLDDSGGVNLVAGDVTSTLVFDDNGCTVQSSQVTLHVNKNSLFQILQDGTIAMERLDADGNILAGVVMDTKNNVAVTAAEDLTLKAKNVYIDGNVYFGKGASDPNLRQVFGEVVTSGPNGTYPTDFSTGAPIPGSSSVKAAGA